MPYLGGPMALEYIYSYLLFSKFNLVFYFFIFLKKSILLNNTHPPWIHTKREGLLEDFAQKANENHENQKIQDMGVKKSPKPSQDL